VLVGENTVAWRHKLAPTVELTDTIIGNFCTEEKGCMKEGSANFNAKTTLDGGGCVECKSDADCAEKSKVTNTTHECAVDVCKPIYTSAKNEMPFGLSSSVFFALSVAALILCCVCLFCIGKRFIVGKDITSQEWNANSSFGAGGSKSNQSVASRSGRTRRRPAE